MLRKVLIILLMMCVHCENGDLHETKPYILNKTCNTSTQEIKTASQTGDTYHPE